MGLTATGAEARLMAVIDRPSDSYDSGQPGFDLTAVADPTTPLVAAEGAVGLISGTVDYKYSFVVGGFETAPSAATGGPVTTTLHHVALSSVDVSADARCTERRIYRTSDTTNYYYVGSIYDNTTTTYDDNLAVNFENLTRTPKATNETSGNWGAAGLRFDSLTLDANYGRITPAELTGKVGVARAYPGNVTVAGNVVGAIRSGSAVPWLAAMYGVPTKTQIGAAWKYLWSLTSPKPVPRTLTLFTHKGGTGMKPETYYGISATQMQMTLNGGAITSDNVTLVGIHHSLSGVGTATTGGATYTGALVTRGVRGDANSSQVFMVKISTAPSTGTFAVKFKVGTVATYTGSALTCYYDTTTKKMIKGGSQMTDWAEGLNESGVRIGFDTGENRLPFEFLFTGDVTGLALNDEFTVTSTALIPGGTGTGYTAVPVREILGPRFGSAHAFIKKDGSIVEAQTAQVTLTAPKQAIYSLGQSARVAVDIVDNGYYGATAQLTRRLSSREWQTVLFTDDRVALTVLLEGEQIYDQPGTASAYRETVQLAFPQFAVTDTNSPVSGPGMVTETVQGAAETPDDGSAFGTVTLYSKHDWQFPA